MVNSKVTIKDLAERLDLSISTISRALSDHKGIASDTKKKVKDLAQELDYFPNSIASNLRQRKTHSIGVIVPQIDVYFHSLVISGIEEIAYKNGYSVTIYQSKDSLEREVAITKSLQENMVAGIITCISLETNNCDHFEKFNASNIPVVLYDRDNNSFKGSKVVIDDYEASFKATEHLISINCKKIAHVAGNQNTGIFRNRLKGYKDALKKHNIDIDENLIVFSKSLSYEEGKRCARKLLSGRVIPDGIFCANDYTAVSAIQVCSKAKLVIPDDIAIIGFSNYPVSTVIEPSLTTIDDMAYKMGQAAIKLLLRQIEQKDDSIASETIVLKTKLIKRESTKREYIS